MENDIPTIKHTAFGPIEGHDPYMIRTQSYIVYCESQNCLIFYQRSADGHILYKFNIITRKTSFLAKCPSHLSVFLAFCMNQNTSEIYVFTHTDKTRVAAKYNILRNEWQIYLSSEIKYKIENITIRTFDGVMHIPSMGINQFVLNDYPKDNDRGVSTKKCKLVKCHDGECWDTFQVKSGALKDAFVHIDLFDQYNMVYVPLLDIILLYRTQIIPIYGLYDKSIEDETNRKIMFINIHEMEETNEGWKWYKGLTFPPSMQMANIKSCKYALFDYILVVTNTRHHSTYEVQPIWCLDLLFTNKWFKLNETVAWFYNYRMIKAKDHVFIIDNMFSEVNKRFTIKIDAIDMIPDELKSLYVKNFTLLIDGYCRIFCEGEGQYKSIRIAFIPNDIKKCFFGFCCAF